MKECPNCKTCFSDTVSHCPQDGMPTFHSIAGEPILEEKYQLEKRVGQGGMGVVYKATHKYLKTAHAIKVILPDLVGNDPQLVTRFRQEALAAAAIRHQNVVAVTDYGVVLQTTPFLVMEFVEGESLHDLLSREQKLSPERATEIISAICAGVGAAHRQGIVHRDLKPLNVMILKDRPISEAVKILDFGLAKIKSGELLGSFVQAKTTGLMGSPYYMAPEQWADDELDVRSDIYSIGVMLYQMIAGDVPFKGSSIPAIMKKHLSDPLPAIALFGVSVTPAVEAAIAHAIAKDRNERTPTVDDVVNEMRHAIGMNTQPLHLTQNTTGKIAPVSLLKVWTKPPKATVFLNRVPVGLTAEDGSLLLEGLQSGSHNLIIKHEGFLDAETNISCDGKPQQVTIELRSVVNTNTQVSDTLLFGQTSNNPQTNVGMNQTLSATAQPSGFVGQSPKKGMFSPAFLAIAGILGLLILSVIGIAGAYFSGLFGIGGVVGSSNTTPSNSNPIVKIEIKPDLKNIPGGKFKMGSNKGKEIESPEHEVVVKDFAMDKTEVTNAEYAQFVAETNHKAPAHWDAATRRPVQTELLFPVVRVSQQDVSEFIKWRSTRDLVTYRLPTEAEWEYAARNGSAQNVYPWGDTWEDGRAVFNGESAPKAVGSMPNGANKWGVLDLVGNVWEWTSGTTKSYPGSNFQIPENVKKHFVIRGGGSTSPTTGEKAVMPTTRYTVEGERQEGSLGFRLVKDGG
jgi:eukaryotic-like serine/threonine-protein kinase